MNDFQPTKDNLQKTEIKQVEQQKIEFTLIGKEEKRAGHTMFSYNKETKEIKVAKIEDCKIASINGTPMHNPRLIVEKNCIYRQALNKKNFIKRLKREGII